MATAYFTACERGQLEATKADLKARGHTIVAIYGPYDDVRLQRVGTAGPIHEASIGEDPNHWYVVHSTN